MSEPEAEISKQKQNDEGDGSKEADSNRNKETDEEKANEPVEVKKNESPSSPNSLVTPPETIIEGDSDREEEIMKKSNANTTTTTQEVDSSILPDSNVKDPNRRICVVTTAGLPWMTGTAVNPLLRALHLTRGRSKHYVSLVIPWCPEEKDRKLTLGKDCSFATSEEQEEWIRTFCRDRAGCPEEESNLKIIFYQAKYNAGFGSIFPSEDICSLIPDEEADVAILEEPEHLNWLRIPKPYTEDKHEGEGKQSNAEDASKCKDDSVVTAKQKSELGWRFKFRHVVGIVHTNYKAYAEQYGVGAAFITAPALCALNALVVRAYCHRVIMLSGTLPSLTPYKEITCNVHGVRGEFLQPPSSYTDAANSESENDEEYAQIYFIGKLIWAKGFDKILDLETLYHEEHKEYFAIDVYGAGGDEDPIKRSFYGRIPQIQLGSPKSADGSELSSPLSPPAEVFTWESSLRSHLVDKVPFRESEKHEAFDENAEITAKRRSMLTDDDDDGAAASTEEQPPKKRPSMLEKLSEKVVPISVIGDLSMKALDTTKATSGAAVAVAKNVVNAGLNIAFTKDASTPQRSSKSDSEAKSEQQRKQKLIFDPPQSVHEFRRNPIPARFLGTKDHVLIRDIREHKIFLNMSTTEVLCTTSAEALAMGKFAVLPKHPSNIFFEQFPNCLQYSSLEECLEKLDYALKNNPKPLDEETAAKLSWEGANERLFKSSTITREEWKDWQENGKIKGDDNAARFHAETGMKGQLIGNFFKQDIGNFFKREKSVDEPT